MSPRNERRWPRTGHLHHAHNPSTLGNVGGHGTTEGPIRCVFDIICGLRQNLAYMADGRLPRDDATVEAQRKLASRAAIYTSVALEHSEVAA